MMCLNVHIDDEYCIGPVEYNERLRAHMHQNGMSITFEIDPVVFTGIETIVDEEGDIQLHNRKLIMDGIKRHGLEEAHTKLMPYSPSQDLPHIDYCEPGLPVRNINGELLFIGRCTKPEIVAPIHELSQHLTKHNHAHLDFGKDIYRYLKGVADVTFPIKPSWDSIPIELFVDSDHVADKSHKCRSIGGWILRLYGTPYDWGSMTSDTTCLNASDAEIIAAERAVKQALILAKAMVEMNVIPEQKLKIIVREDNKGTKDTFENELGTNGVRHLRIKIAWIRELVADGIIEFDLVKSEDNDADMMTKRVTGPKFYKFSSNVNPNLRDHWISKNKLYDFLEDTSGVSRKERMEFLESLKALLTKQNLDKVDTRVNNLVARLQDRKGGSE